MLVYAYPDSHVSSTAHGKLRLGVHQRLDTLAQFLSRLGPEHTARRHDFRVGPEVLRLILVDSGAGRKHRAGQGLVEGLAAGRGGLGGNRSGRRRQREEGGDAHGVCFLTTMALRREGKQNGGEEGALTAAQLEWRAS